MSIDFDPQRWNRIKADSAKWWAGELQRPLIQLVIGGRDPGRPQPAIPSLGFLPQYGDAISAEQIVDRWEYDLSCCRYLGDGFPSRWLNFGAGVVAALLGCDLSPADDTVWFSPPRPLELGEVELHFDPENKWLRRISTIMKTADERFRGTAQIGMVDLGGTMDILSSFRPSEKLLLDVADDPDRVERLVWQVHDLWAQYFTYFDAILRRHNPGWTCWTPIFSTEPYYMLQCDFCYMIGPKMFDRFVKPDLAACCRRLPHAFYHLDGIGELPHLDSLLEINELKGVQWIPGAGKPHPGLWPEVIKKIHAAGKLLQVFGGPEVLDAITDHLGTAKGVCLVCESPSPPKKEKELERFLLKYGAL